MEKNEEAKPAEQTKEINKEAAPPQQLPPVYKFQPAAYADLGAYLLTCPLREVQVLYSAFFRHGQQDPFYRADAIQKLMTYLGSRPMGEVEGLVSSLQNGGLIPIPQSVAANVNGEKVSEKKIEDKPGEKKEEKPEAKEEKQPEERPEAASMQVEK